MLQFFIRLIIIWSFQCYCSEASLSDIGRDAGNFASQDQDEVVLEQINGTQDYFLTRRTKENKSWYGREMVSVQCLRNAKCEPVKHKLCLGSKLPYSNTSIHLTYSYNQEKAYEVLQQYMVLKQLPKCWAVVQPFLCATFMPKCELINGVEMVHLPSLEMCRIIMEPCKLVYDTPIFPEFLKCNTTRLHSKCDNDVREMKFNTSGRCLPPLVHTDIPFHFYEGVSGCGLPCRNPLYTQDEHDQIKGLVLWGASISLAFTIFTISTFLVNWRSSSKYPALVIFYINVCYMISSIGWLSQFMFDSGGKDIVCSKDGTRRRSEPSAGENLSCVIIFVLVYYFLIAACVWFVIFTYAWHISFKALGKMQERIDKKGAYFHLVAWSLPLILTITIMALGEIDGSSITGICFVGYLNHHSRAGFLLGPLLAVLLIGGFFLLRGIFTLIFVRTTSKDIISVRASSKIRSTILKGSATAVFVFIFISVTFMCHAYEFMNSKSWYDSFRLFLICRLTSMYSGTDQECMQISRPSVAVLQLQLLCLFCSVGLMASWVFTGATLKTWKRYIRTKFGCEKEEPVKLQKHKLIAQAFARRKEFHNQGRMSISFYNTHTDPVGLNFELNSVASHDFSSTWANNLPRFVKRRGALTGAQNSHSQSSSAPRRNSQDSQISFSLRHVSVESRRNSLDSQVSVKIAEMKTKVASRRVKPHKSSRRRPPRKSTVYTRKESTTSIESQIGTHIVRAMSSTNERRHDNIPRVSHRRIANAGLNQEQINLLLENGKFILPFLQNQGLTSTSDEENMSTASLKICGSQLNIELYKKNPINSMINESNQLAIAPCNSDSDSESKNAETYNFLAHSSDDNFRRDLKDVCGSKSSSKSKSSRRSSRLSGRIKSKRLVKNSLKGSKNSSRARKRNNSEVNEKAKTPLDSSMDSYCSELGRLALQSSFSGVSVEKNNSRNSKTSCDVGIQANLQEIATLASQNSDVTVKNKLNILKSHNSSIFSGSLLRSGNSGSDKKNKDKEMVVLYKNNDDLKSSKKFSAEYAKNGNKHLKNDESNEPLLSNKHGEKQPVIVKKKIDIASLSESKKLKQLLLPSTK